MCETIFELDFGFNVPNSACESIIGLCCLELIVKLKYKCDMDNIADIEASIAEERFIEDNALFKRGQRVHTWLNDKLVVGVIVDIDTDGEEHIVYDINVGAKVLHFIPEYMLITDGITAVDAVLLPTMPF